MRLEKKETFITSVHVLRGIAALLVVFEHAFVRSDLLKVEWMKPFIGQFGQDGVVVFFVISGFVLPYALAMGGYEIANFPRFMLKRILRLEPVYLVSLAVTVLLIYFKTRSPSYPGSPWQIDSWQILAHVAYLAPVFRKDWLNEVYWTLGIEFQFYIIIGLLFPVIMNSSKNLGKNWVATIPILASLPTLGGCEYNTLTNFSAVFACGFLLFLKIAGRVNSVPFISALLVCTSIFMTATTPRLGATAMVTALLIAFWKPTLNRITRFLGDISYSLYVIHMPIVWSITRAAPTVTQNVVAHHVIWVFAIVASIFGGWLLWQTVETRSLRWSKSVTLHPVKKNLQPV